MELVVDKLLNKIHASDRQNGTVIATMYRIIVMKIRVRNVRVMIVIQLFVLFRPKSSIPIGFDGIRV